jgi:MoaA/NifB/PqqE/SkfB family radical SAM enzyme
MLSQLKKYLQDPFLNRLYCELREVGSLRSILVDMTHVCNLRCQGCYFFFENMDESKSPEDEAEFDAFIEREKARGTNFVTAVGGEPSLVLGRLKKIYENFWMSMATNGLRKIPYEGFENMPILISVWGDHETDIFLRGSSKIDVFAKALRNYKDDRRAKWYYTTTPGRANEIDSVVEQCVANGNFMMFSYYGDLSGLGGDFDHRRSFESVKAQVNRMIDRYPDRILTTAYVNEVSCDNVLLKEPWSYDVCTTITFDNEINRERVNNGNPYNLHFRAYNPDLKSTRRCCVGNESDCTTCRNVYAKISWIMLHMRRHLGSKQDFTNWLTAMYTFYLANRIVDFEEGVKLLPEIHGRLRNFHSQQA